MQSKFHAMAVGVFDLASYLNAQTAFVRVVTELEVGYQGLVIVDSKGRL